MLRSLCVVYECDFDIEIHHIRKLKNVVKNKDWLSKTTIKYSCKQISDYKSCYQKIYIEKYDGTNL